MIRQQDRPRIYALVRLLVAFSFFLLPLTSIAQGKGEKKSLGKRITKWISGNPYDGTLPLLTTHSDLLISVGTIGVRDTYLSEITHTGLCFGLHYKTDYPLHAEGDKWHLYDETHLTFGLPQNPANHSKLFLAGGSYSIGASWRGLSWHGLSLDLAPLLRIHGGINYKPSNFNNISNAKGGISLDAWARLIYRVPLHKFPMQIMLSTSLPCFQLLFTPGYGQSYYEYIAGSEKLGKLEFHPASFHNSCELRQTFQVDLPIHDLTISLGAEYLYLNQRLNNIEYKQGSWTGLIGVAFDLMTFSGNRVIRSPYLRNARD